MWRYLKEASVSTLIYFDAEMLAILELRLELAEVAMPDEYAQYELNYVSLAQLIQGYCQ